MVLTRIQALPELFNVGTQDVEPYTTTLDVSTEVHAVTTTTGEWAPQRQEYIALRWAAPRIEPRVFNGTQIDHHGTRALTDLATSSQIS